ncbi:MAG: hydantoinase/oxoprolinase family protein [Acidobacteriaceae bacterium]
MKSEVANLKLSPVRVAVDTGGTFTDCVWVEEGELRTLKVFSTPGDPSVAIEQAVRKAVGERDFILLHGTTVGTNALLERKGARVALITTAGFEDAIEIGRQARPKLYDFFADRPEPLAAAGMRFGVRERIAADGSVVEALTDEEIERVIDLVDRSGAEAVAVSLLFSFANPEHEKRLEEAFRNRDRNVWATVPPAASPSCESFFTTFSYRLLPEFREYERMSTVVMNAYLQPLMGRYLGGLQGRMGASAKARGREVLRCAQDDKAREVRSGRIFVMQSSGGISALQTVLREPVRTVLSGPAGGVVGARAMARTSGFEKAISFDMGGTSTDVALIEGTLRTTNEGEIIGLPVRVPMLDIHTLGAGGGSIARFDAAGALRVGPQSAGAEPGPICYGKGMQPTVTDANLLLGRLRADCFLGGEFVLDLERTRRITREWLKQQGSRWRLEEFAEGILRVVNASMEKAIRAVSVERGHDPREFTLVAFGGAGALHAGELAQALQIPRVLVPQSAGALSAYGILVSDVVKEFSRTVMLRAEMASEGRVRAAAAAIKELALSSFADEGYATHRVKVIASLDLRYRGQGFELNVRFARGAMRSAVAEFHREHKRRYGYADEGREVEVVNVRVRATLETRLPTMRGRRPAAAGAIKMIDAYFRGKTLRTKLIERESMAVGQCVKGPAVITEYSATTVVPVGASAELDGAGGIVVSC